MRGLSKMGRSEQPLAAFDKDFLAFIRESREEGYQLIVMMDANTNINNSNFATKMRREGLQDHVSQLPENVDINSFFRGTEIIDGIFLSRTLVQLGGHYQSFSQSPGDHRGICIEVCATAALGNHNPITLPRQPRRLQVKIPSTVQHFNRIYEQHIKTHKLDKRARRLHRTACSPLTPQQVKEFEAIDDQMVIGMKVADKGCRKLKMGGIQWTPKYSETNDTINVCRLILKKNKGGKVKTSLIKRTLKKAKLPRRTLTLSNEEIRIMEAEAHQERRRYRKDDVGERNEWLDSQSKIFDRGKPKIAGKIRAKKNREQMRRTSRRIKMVLKPFRPRGVTKIIVAGEEVTTHEGIIEGFKTEAIKRGSQTEDTPLMSAPLLEDFGYKATNQNAEKVLNGTYQPPPGSDQYAVKLFPHLKRPDIITESGRIKKEISQKEYVQAWKNKKEYTGSGPSGLHYGHFKAMVWSKKTAALHTDMINVPMISGYSPERWRKADDHMEQKSPDNFNVNRFRPIIHVEADFNMANGFIGRKVMANAEKHNTLAPEQYGSRKHKSAQDQALNKRLMFDVTRQTKKPTVLVVNDAKSCYDRIVHVMVMLCARRTGMDLEPIMAMIDTIQLMAHQIHSAYGASLGYGPDDWDVPFQGMLQGNQFGPPSWAIVSSPLFDMLRAEGYGLRLCSPLSRSQIHLAGLAFVDDTDTAQNGRRHNDSGKDVIRYAQVTVDHWNGGLRTTGGALDPGKTYWYLMDFLWKEGIWKYDGLDENNKLTMLDSEGNRVNLKQLPVHKGMRTLGVILAPDGNNEDQVEALIERAEQWAELITTGHLERTEAWRALTSTILKSLEYPLTATTLTIQETRKIFAPVRQAALPASGIVRTFPSAIAHAPLQYQGLAIPDLYATQQTKHVLTLLKFGGTKTVTGQLIQHSLEHFKIELGISRPLQEIRLADIAFLATECWVKTTYLFLEKYFLTINEEPQFMLRRDRDGYLMEQFYSQPNIKRQWAAINRCRLYHKLLTLSDLITGTGRKLRQDIWTERPSLEQDDRTDWPRQGTPSIADWKVWQTCLLTLFDCRAKNGIISLQFQLGEGTVTTTWKWFYYEETLYKQDTETVQIYNQYGTRRSRCKRYRHTGTTQAKPIHALPCTVERAGSMFIMTGVIQPEELPSDDDTLPPFVRHIQKKLNKAIIPEQFIWMFYDNEPPSETQMQQLQESLEREELIGCTDASTKDGISTASFKFQTKQGTTVLQGEVLVPGDRDVQCSHRGEMGGAAAALTYLQTIVEYKHIQSGSVRFGCDSDNVVNIGLRQTLTTSSVADHYDLVRRCHEAREALLPITLIPMNVKGHTDSVHGKKTVLEKMNIECDRRAGLRRQAAKKAPESPTVPSQIGYWQLAHHNEPVLVRLQENIRLCIQEYDAYNYWTETNYNPIRKDAEGGSDIFRTIHWEAIKKAMCSSSQYKRHFVSKHATGHCGVGKMMKIWGFRDKDNCPRCKKANETALHVLTCQHETARGDWEVEIERLQEWFQHFKTDPHITNAIVHNLRKWRKSGGLFGHHYQEPSIRKALQEQKDIGWDHFMLGRISQRWSTLQEKYYKRQKLRKTGDKWAEELIKEIWRIHCAIWNRRNEILHGTGNHKVLGTKDFHKEIKEQLDEGYDLLLPTEHYLFRGINMKIARKWTANKKDKWLRTVRAARHTSNLRHQATLPSRQSLRNWLQG
jgi:hypothetical protein